MTYFVDIVGETDVFLQFLSFPNWPANRRTNQSVQHLSACAKAYEDLNGGIHSSNPVLSVLTGGTPGRAFNMGLCPSCYSWSLELEVKDILLLPVLLWHVL